ncbi:hypothetical protein BRC86_11430 [Halobacteriales archaeon QS_3_64_16]|nr:MAG: hypothetical protein BRC86_11430 [Halobacteriales archaeon QS_3_64_16]
MTVCLTGDVHHASLETRDQAYLDGTEAEAALRYAEIAADHGVPVTLFVTGKTAVEEPDSVRELIAMENVEVGGHNYWAFDTLAHKGFRGLTGSWNGPAWFQSWEVGRTVEALDGLGADVRSWRDHAYRHDGKTAGVLSENGITHFSDAVGPDERVREDEGVTVVPINTPPDHEHVYHAFRTPEFVAEDGFEGPFGSESVAVETWVEWVIESVDRHASRGEAATVLAHPACMALADGMGTFEDLCAALGEHDSIWMGEMGEVLNRE